MGQSKEKGGRGKGRNRRIISLTILLVLSLAIFFTLRKELPEEEPDFPVIPSPTPPVEKKVPAKPAALPRLALIIDDGGYNTEAFKGMMGMGRPMTFSILPNTPHAWEAALMAHQEGSEVMLHLPMEPEERELLPLEKDTIRTGMSARAIQKILQEDLMQIPYVRGVNNHMGSKATADPKVMRALMGTLKKEGLYFIDSHTTLQTLGPEIARRAGVASWHNSRFIDREKNMEAIKREIRFAMRKAKKEGKAVAIGHPNPLTARAIKEMIPEIEREGIRLVFASEVVG
jgi:polysaccharide deacetylase 2 family uncharacterized protein YibQ